MRINSAIQAAIDLTAGAAGNAGENFIAQNFRGTVLVALTTTAIKSLACLLYFKDMEVTHS